MGRGGPFRGAGTVAVLRAICSLILGAALLAACSSGHTTSTPSTTVALATTSTSAGPPPVTVPSTTSSTPPVTVPSRRWTEHELLSQLIMVGATYTDPGASTAIARSGAGGLVFFDQPAAGSGATLASESAALTRAASVPPFMTTDEEGGDIARLATVVGPLPWPREMATQWTPAEVTAQLTTVGSAMRAVGMNMDLAPVLDTASSGDTIGKENLRSFSADGSTAATYGLAYLHGLTASGIVGVVKHFPGLGHADGNTDLHPATDPPLAELSRNDLVPFRRAVAAGVRVVMMSNVTEPDWGPAPASLNAAAYSYLRHMGFNGMVLTDSLDAGAVTATGVDAAGATAASVEAGADMALIRFPSEYAAALAALEAAVASGRLPIDQVVASVDRIVAVKNSILPAAEAIAPPG